MSDGVLYCLIWGLIFFLVFFATIIAKSVLDSIECKGDKNNLSVISWSLLFISLLFLSMFIFAIAMLKEYELGYKKGLNQSIEWKVK